MKKLDEVISNLEAYRGVEYINREELIKSLKLAKEEITKQLSIHGVVGRSEQCEHRYGFIIPNGGGAMQCSDCGEEI
jgi:hypothetical protein